MVFRTQVTSGARVRPAGQPAEPFDRLAALWWLIALRGLRRGEAAALDRDDLDAQAQELTISRQIAALPGELYCGPPKSRASSRTIALDEAGARMLAGQPSSATPSC